MTDPAVLDPGLLPAGIRSRFVPKVNGLNMHLLEAGHETPGRPCVLLLHGFPELAYSWRKLMPEIAAAGYHVIAPDQRGYGRTTGWDDADPAALGSFGMLNLVRDAMGLLAAIGVRSVDAVVGHDFGSPVAAWCALVRPDVFRSVVLMSAPFGGPPPLPLATAQGQPQRPTTTIDQLLTELAALPRPRKHYQWYYASPEANADLWRCPQGVHAMLRAYYHHKSADWPGNQPQPLASMSAAELAKMPTYYIMDLARGMAETVADEMPSAAEIAACGWLTEHELGVYAAEYQRTGFQGGLLWYRCRTAANFASELQLFSGLKIEVPALFIAGRSDWGVYQNPGAFEAMQTRACTQLQGCQLIDGAGHWVQQEQPEAVNRLLLGFLRDNKVADLP